MLVIFLGAPGSGKGTISDSLVENHNFKHISTGDIFRKTIQSGSELGNKVKGIIEGGNLVDDATTWEVAKFALDQYDLNNEDIILDGYPRNIVQGNDINEYLIENNVENVKVLYFEVPNDVILARLTGRMMCKVCGKAYHKINMPPKVEGVCDIDGGELYQREDDKIENVSVRLDTYNEVTQPLIDLYEQRGSLITINGNGSKDEITQLALEALK